MIYLIVLVVGIIALLSFAFNPTRISKRAQEKLLGSTAYTTIAIPANGVGMINVTLWNGRRDLPACSVAGTPIAYRHDVIIEAFRNGVAYVRPWDSDVKS